MDIDQQVNSLALQMLVVRGYYTIIKLYNVNDCWILQKTNVQAHGRTYKGIIAK